jgi:hypothetical protein
MNLTINELIEKLGTLDELTILELLDITSEELVVFLEDQIIERQDVIREYLADEED